MKTRFINLAATLVVSLSCLFWISLIMLVMMHLLGATAETTFGTGAILGILSALAIMLMGREFENAIEIPDYDDYQALNSSARTHLKKSKPYSGKTTFLRLPRENF